MFGSSEGLRRVMDRETSKPTNVGRTLSRFIAYFKLYWPLLLLVLVMIVVSTWAQVVIPELIGQVVDCYLVPASGGSSAGFPGAPALPGSSASSSTCWVAQGSQPSGITQNVITSLYTVGGFPQPSGSVAGMSSAVRIAGLGRMVAIIVGLFIFSSIVTGMMFYAMTWSGQHVMRNLREDVFRQLHRLSLSYYAEHEAGDLMSRITNDAETITQALNFGLVNVLSGVLLLFWIGYNMLSQSLALGLLSLAVVPLMALATIWFSSQARKAFRRTRLEMGSVNAELQESISAVREVQAFNRADENIENFRIANAANRDANIRAVAYTSALAPSLEALGYVALAIVSVVGGLLLLGPGALFGATISLGLIITFLGYVQRFNQPIQQISVLWTNLQSAVAGAERIFSLLDENPAIQDDLQAPPMPRIQGLVEFSSVSAAYKKDQAVLERVSFTAQPGQTVAIVGPTGAGKTTLINLIPRFYDVTGGSVLVDGRDVRYVQVESLRQQIGIVLQDTFLFSTSVIENIRFGRPGASDEEVIAAAKLAHADAFIERLPKGYQTVLGERGSGLSQGQRQLLAIARAALVDPRILILDEATSSVDTRTERLIQKALEELLEGRTSFVIAHRLSTIRNADVLLVLDQGQIVERGTHTELLERKGFYYDLYMSQFRGDGADPGRLEEIPSGNGRPSGEMASA
jgi:ATP-binding cassette subfamily B multidrug efflux pump